MTKVLKTGVRINKLAPVKSHNSWNWDHGNLVFDPQPNKKISTKFTGLLPHEAPPKPDVGNKESITRLVEALKDKRDRITKKMSVIAGELRQAETLDKKLLDEYATLNKRLRALSIQKAEFIYLKNML